MTSRTLLLVLLLVVSAARTHAAIPAPSVGRVEPSGVEPSGVEPSGAEPFGVEPSWVEPSGVEPRRPDEFEASRQRLEKVLIRWRSAETDTEIEYRKGEERRVNEAVTRIRITLEMGEEASLEREGILLLDLAAISCHRRLVRARTSTHSADSKLSRRVFAAMGILLEGRRRGELGAWLGRIVADRAQPEARRVQALELVADHRPEEARTALLLAGRDRQDALCIQILETFSVWSDEASDLLLVRLLGSPYEGAGGFDPWNAFLQRVRHGEGPIGGRAAEELLPRVSLMILSNDWREASIAIEASGGLVPEVRVPLLLEALSAWTRREQDGRGSKRILEDVLAELRRISGRTIGRNPRNWATWWVAVRQGRTELHASQQPGAMMTEAGFFGLRPMSDQVTFILDISGSMDGSWGTTGRTRYIEAVEQMMRFLHAAGEATRFNVILFNSEVVVSSRKLVPATANNLRRVKASLQSRSPGGGTYLRKAVLEAVPRGSSGLVDLKQLETDTVIILCDGATGSGSSWVDAFLDGIRRTRMRFHCVLMASSGDGTLEALAGGTGGDFIRVGG